MRLTIRTLGIITCGVLSIVLCGAVIFSIKDSHRQQALVSRAAEAARIVDAGYRATIPLSLERSLTQVGLTLATPLPANFAALRQEQQRKSDAVFEELVAMVRSANSLDRVDQHLAVLDGLRREIAALRERANVALSLPRERRAADASGIPTGIIDTVMRVNEAMSSMIDEDSMAQARIHSLVSGAYQIWRVREYEGQARTLMAAALLHKRPMTAAEIKAAGDLITRAEASFDNLRLIRRGLDPAARALMASLDQAYGQTYRRMRESVINAAQTGAYALEFDGFFARSADGMAAIEEAALGLSARALAAARQTADDVQRAFFVTLAVELAVLAVIAVIMWLIVFWIAGRITKLNTSMMQLAAGEAGVEIGNTRDKDEIGDMARALLVFRDNAAQVAQLAAERAAMEERQREVRQQEMRDLAAEFQADVGGIVGSLSSSAEEMTRAARSMLGAADDAGKRAGSVLSSAEQASGLAGSVAAATEEMTSSIGEIGRQVQTSTQRTAQAVRDASTASEQIGALAESVDKIGHVVDLINSIAAQTNLLALNATIEAARAGEAGKGFAVVASEVKALAAQTAKATADISAQIASVQQATNTTVVTIRDITGAIAQLEEIAAAIAAAVEEQHAVTADISGNISRTSQLTQAVSGDMGAMSAAATETSSAATQVMNTAHQLSTRSEELAQAMASFVSRVRAA